MLTTACSGIDYGQGVTNNLYKPLGGKTKSGNAECEERTFWVRSMTASLGLLKKTLVWHLRIPCPGFSFAFPGFTFWYCLSRMVGVLAFPKTAARNTINAHFSQSGLLRASEDAGLSQTGLLRASEDAGLSQTGLLRASEDAGSSQSGLLRASEDAGLSQTGLLRASEDAGSFQSGLLRGSEDASLI